MDIERWQQYSKSEIDLSREHDPLVSKDKNVDCICSRSGDVQPVAWVGGGRSPLGYRSRASCGQNFHILPPVRLRGLTPRKDLKIHKERNPQFSHGT